MRHRSRRFRGALVVGSAAVIVVAFAVFVWRGAPWLDASRLKALTPVQQETAVDAIRGRLLQLGAGLVVSIGLVYTALNFRLSRESHVTDRYTKAIEQLGSTGLDVRLGAIYALERIIIDSPRDHPTIVEVLAAFVREHSPAAPPPPYVTRRGKQVESTPPVNSSNKPSTDLRAAMTVLVRRPSGREEPGLLDLAGVNLAQIALNGANLTRANLEGAYLEGANLRGADLTDANLTSADLTNADLSYANLKYARLISANLTSASLSDANLKYARLTSADLTSAYLGAADMTGANLEFAHLTGANLRYANLKGTALTYVELPDSLLDNPTLPDRFRPPPPPPSDS